jgi:diguanylate cyclase (GGDEF)-like protein
MAIEFAPSARVLLAEGNRFHTHLITRALYDAGYEVHAVGTRAESDALGLDSFDALLVADHLEDGSGLDLLRDMTTRPGAPPAILLVDPREPVEPTAALAAGAVDQVVKEPDLAMPLRLALSRALERRRMLDKIADLERRLEESTRVDAVSGVYTGRYFEEILERELQRIKRFGGTMAILRLAGPNATSVERTLGSHVRDRILREVGAVLQASLRLTDLAGSWPDGRFLVALTGTDRSGAERVAERLERKLAELESWLALSPGMLPRLEILGAGGFDQIHQLLAEA